jgi:arginine utilization protein RocB
MKSGTNTLKKHNKQNKTKQNKTKQNKTKQNKTKQNKTKQNKKMGETLFFFRLIYGFSDSFLKIK